MKGFGFFETRADGIKPGWCWATCNSLATEEQGSTHGQKMTSYHPPLLLRESVWNFGWSHNTWLSAETWSTLQDDNLHANQLPNQAKNANPHLGKQRRAELPD